MGGNILSSDGCGWLWDHDERLSGGNVAVALPANTLATGAALVALIPTLNEERYQVGGKAGPARADPNHSNLSTAGIGPRYSGIPTRVRRPSLLVEISIAVQLGVPFVRGRAQAA